MNCTCGSDTIVKDSRRSEDGQWRKRQCIKCGQIFTTIEVLCETLPHKRGKPFGEIKPVERPIRVRRDPNEPKKKPGPKPKTPEQKMARQRIEDMKAERELNGLV